MKLSFVVPVYQAELHLEQCVNSILSQIDRDMEIILVDDGSPDQCGILCDRIVAEDNRVKVIHKENGGVSSARNMALDIVAGDYITFVDSDDYLSDRYMETIKPLLDVNTYDIILFDWYNDSEKGLEHGKANLNQEMSSLDIFRAILEDKTPCYAWNKIFKRSLWEKNRFPEGANFEDLAIMPFVFEGVQHIFYIPEPLYIYNCKNTGSITSNLSAKSKYGLFWSFFTRQQLARKWGFLDLLAHFRLRAIRSSVTGLGFHAAKPQLSDEQVTTMLTYLREEAQSGSAPKVGLKYELLWHAVLQNSPICRWYGKSMFMLEQLKKKFKS